MYNDHFGFSEPPFGISPDPQFTFCASTHQEALNTLLLAVAGGEGFIKITGEVGTGKTLLCRRFMSLLDANHVVAYLPNPMMEARGLLSALASEFEVPMPPDVGLHDQLRVLNAFLLLFAGEGKKVVVCIDEAQAMPLEALEALRLLSNLETDKRKLLQVVMFGQPELDEKLARNEARQLRQRITFEYRLRPLERAEVASYLAHRLQMAGHSGGPVFSDRAARQLYRATSGVPRLLNIVAHKALLTVYGEGGGHVKVRHVREAVKDTPAVHRPMSWLWAAMPAIVLMLGIGIGMGMP